MSAATATTFPVLPNWFPKPYPVHYPSASYLRPTNNTTLRSSISAPNLGGLVMQRPARLLPVAKAVSRVDDSTPSGKSVENALKLLGVYERLKNSIVAACKDDEDAVRWRLAYDMLLAAVFAMLMLSPSAPVASD